MAAWSRRGGIVVGIVLLGTLWPAGGRAQDAGPRHPSFNQAQDAVQGLWECMLDWRESLSAGKEREVLLPEGEKPLNAWERYMKRRREREEKPTDSLARFDEYLAECAARAMIRAARADGIVEGCLTARGPVGGSEAPAKP